MMPNGAELIAWLADVLLQSVWIAAAVALPAWATVRRVRDPRTVHQVVLGALLLIATAVFTVGIMRWPSAPATTVALVVPSALHGPNLFELDTAPASTVFMAALGKPTWNWRAYVVLAWCVGVSAMSLRHAAGWWWALRLRRTADLIEGGLARRFGALCRAAGMPAPLLLASARIAVPAAIGWWRQAVVVPVGLLTGLPAAQLDALILHELAHLRRHDWLVEMVVSLLESALFFHPAVWWLGRRLRQAREQCCDAQALRAGADPEGLMRALLALAERTAPDSPVLAATGGVLADRVRRILGLPERHERPWRALATIALLPVLLVIPSACASIASRTHSSVQPMAVDAPIADGPTREYPLARRIRAHADCRLVRLSVQTIAAPSSFWKRLDLDGGRQLRLDHAGVGRVLAMVAADAHAQVLDHPQLTTFALQRGNASFIHQYVYISDYRQIDGRPDCMISVLNYGNVFEGCAEPSANGVVLAEARCKMVEPEGFEQSTFSWSIDGVDTTYPIEMPVVVVEEGQAEPDTELRLGEALAIPLICRVQRSSPTFRHALEHGTMVTRVPDPDLQARPRRVCLVSAEVVGSGASQLDATPEAAAWLDSTLVTFDLHHVPLDTAMTHLAEQLPVPVEVIRDADYAATQVDLIAQGEPARAVLRRLLVQCLLDGIADADRLRFEPRPVINCDAPILNHFAAAKTGSKGFEIIPGPACAKTGSTLPTKGFETLPGPAWETPVRTRYDLRDLIMPSLPPGRQGGWCIAGQPSPQASSFVHTFDAAAALRQAVFPATWSADRTIEVDVDGVVINAAPAVHRVIVAELNRRRSENIQVHLHLDLVRLPPGTWTALGLAEMASSAASTTAVHGMDDDLLRRIRAAASAAGDQPDGMEAVIGKNLEIVVGPGQASWWSGRSYTLRPSVSADLQYVTLSLISPWIQAGQDGHAERISSTMHVGEGILVKGLGDGSALLVKLDSVQ